MPLVTETIKICGNPEVNFNPGTCPICKERKKEARRCLRCDNFFQPGCAISRFCSRCAFKNSRAKDDMATMYFEA